jgi:transcription elongation factor Elf1
MTLKTKRKFNSTSKDEVRKYNLIYKNNMNTIKKEKSFLSKGDMFECIYCNKLLNVISLKKYKNKSILKTISTCNYVIIICGYCELPFIMKKTNNETFKIPNNILVIKKDDKYNFINNNKNNERKYASYIVKT